MSNEEQKHFLPYLRTFKIENIPRLKISLVDEESPFEINRIFMPIDLNDSLEETFEKPASTKPPIVNTPSTSEEGEFFQQTTRTSPSKTQSIKNIIDHKHAEIVGYNHEEHLLPTTIVSIDSINKHSLSSSKRANQIDSHSSVRQVEQSLSPPLSQLMPDLIINGKQTTKRISNETNSTHLSKFIPLTPNNKTFKSINDDLSSSNHVRFYQIGSIFTSTSTFLMHQNRVSAHATASDHFLSDTIFIILIATLTIIILLFCLGLFCLCRRTTKRNISPSFNDGSYAGLNEQSFGIPVENYQQQTSKYENNIRTDLPSSVVTQPLSTNDRIPSPQTVALHHTIRQKIPINNKKLKKKRVGFCCCHSKQTPSTTVNARTRM